MTDAEKTVLKDALNLLNDGLSMLSALEASHPMTLIMVKLVQGVVKSAELML